MQNLITVLSLLAVDQERLDCRETIGFKMQETLPLIQSAGSVALDEENWMATTFPLLQIPSRILNVGQMPTRKTGRNYQRRSLADLGLTDQRIVRQVMKTLLSRIFHQAMSETL